MRFFKNLVIFSKNLVCIIEPEAEISVLQQGSNNTMGKFVKVMVQSITNKSKKHAFSNENKKKIVSYFYVKKNRLVRKILGQIT